MAGLRYVLAIALRTQRWAPPAIVLVGLIAWAWFAPPLMLSATNFVALLLFALASWLGYATATAEDPGQEAIAVSNYGSYGRLALARWAAAFLLAAPFPLILLFGSYFWHAFTDRPTLAAVGAAGLLLLSTAACGAAIGALVGSLLPTRPAWAAALLFIAALGEAAPAIPPVGLGNPTLTPTGPEPLSQLILAIGLGLILAAAALTLASWWHRRARPGGSPEAGQHSS